MVMFVWQASPISRPVMARPVNINCQIEVVIAAKVILPVRGLMSRIV